MKAEVSEKCKIPKEIQNLKSQRAANAEVHNHDTKGEEMKELLRSHY